MAEKQDVSGSSAAPMCANGCGFFGSAATKNFCSKCYNDLASKAVDAAAVEAAEEKVKAIALAPPVPAVADDATAVEKKETTGSSAPILCAGGCGFFGSAATKNMCSKCYIGYIKTVDAAPALVEKIKADKAALAQPIAAAPAAVAALEVEVPAVKAAPNRCATCRAKVGLLGFSCRCGGTFCKLHRYAEKHDCNFDFKKADREQIAKNNPLVVAPKINKI